MTLRALLLVVTSLASIGCVSHLPIAEQAPHAAFRAPGPVVVSVIDERHWLREGKDGKFLGRAHGSFGIPIDIEVYPYYAVGRKNKAQTLASAVEERLVLGLSSDGWTARGAASSAPLAPEQIRAALAGDPASKLIVLKLHEWFVSLNLNWVTAFNFDWDVELEVVSADGSSVTHAAKGRDVVDVAYDQSYPNHIRIAYRERLSRLLAQPQVRAALEGVPVPATETPPTGP